ncbi:hypothetical protein N0V94_000162 [Neodidymelliopsis sp. IMI 364377]|nr:hypothetical protein N0V94_000162 [Neodidymelliopsis sp. IMI 364377]
MSSYHYSAPHTPRRSGSPAYDYEDDTHDNEYDAGEFSTYNRASRSPSSNAYYDDTPHDYAHGNNGEFSAYNRSSRGPSSNAYYDGSLHDSDRRYAPTSSPYTSFSSSRDPYLASNTRASRRDKAHDREEDLRQYSYTSITERRTDRLTDLGYGSSGNYSSRRSQGPYINDHKSRRERERAARAEADACLRERDAYETGRLGHGARQNDAYEAYDQWTEAQRRRGTERSRERGERRSFC